MRDKKKKIANEGFIGNNLELLKVTVNPCSSTSSTIRVELNRSAFITLDCVDNCDSLSEPSELDHEEIPIDPSQEDDDMLEFKKAAAQGNIQSVKKFCLKNKIIQKLSEHVTRKNGDTPFFHAAIWDQFETVKVLLDAAAKKYPKQLMVNLINLQDYTMENESPISYAASRYHMRTCLAVIDQIAPLRLDPFQSTKNTSSATNVNGTSDDRILTRDLETGFVGVQVKDTNQDEIEALHKPCVGFCSLSTETMKKFVEDNEPLIHYHQKNSRDKSLIVVLLRKMPSLVEQILDKSITLTEIRSQGNKSKCQDIGDIHRVIVDLGVLEYHPKPKEHKSYRIDDTFDNAGPIVKPRHYRHGLNPLQVLAKTNRAELLRHPVVYALIMKKWENYAKGYFYSVTLLLYILFFAMLMVYQSTLIKPFVTFQTKNETKMVPSWIENSTHLCDEYPHGCFKEKSVTCLTSGYFVLIMSGVRLFLETLDLMNQIFVESHLKNQESFVDDSSARYVVLTYFHTWSIGVGSYFMHLENLLEVVLYGTSVIFSVNVMEHGRVISPLYWQIGTLCVLASFANLLLLLQIVPLIGVYITMFFRILWTFVTKILALLTFFVIAFVIIFHMLLSHDSTIFKKPVSGASVYKTLSQGVSGVSYDDYDLNFRFPVSSLIGLIAFAIIVQVLFLNLATGLAIEDVKKIRVGAEMAMNVLKIRHIYNAGRSLIIVRQVFNHVPFLKGREPKPIRRIRRFQNIASRNFQPEIIQKIRDLMEKTKGKETSQSFEGNKLSISFKLDVDQLARLNIIQAEDP